MQNYRLKKIKIKQGKCSILEGFWGFGVFLFL